MKDLDQKTKKIAVGIENEFVRLKITTDDDPCSGLMVGIPNVVTEFCLVNIYDDNEDVEYDGEAVLDYLKTLEPEDVSLISFSHKNIWNLIQEFEV